MTTVDDARTALAQLALRYEWLENNLLNGTPRPYRAPHLTGEARAVADAEARLERHERVDIAPGDSPDPYPFDIADLRRAILTGADAMSARVAKAARRTALAVKERDWTLDMPDADPSDYAGLWITWTSGCLAQACETEPALAKQVYDKTELWVMRADALLGLITDGQTLPRPCPFCRGRSDSHPEGGALTLRVRLKHREHGRAEDCNEWCVWLLVCENPMCEPGEAMAGQAYKGRPAWLLSSEGEWVARCMDAVDAGQTCRCGQPLPTKGKRGRPARFCSEECRRAADAERKQKTRAA